jgi:hypothetical protein
MTTIENNKLIAEFMGIPLEEGQEQLFIQGHGTKLIEDTFNTRWDWLMEVVGRINDLNNVVQIHDNHVKIVNNTKSEVLVEVIEGSMFEAIYQAIVEFIKNYKNN